MCQRNDGRIDALLVTCRHVHVAKLAVRGGDAPPGTYRDVGTIAAFFPRRETKEPLARGFTPAVAAVVDVAGRHRELTGEAGTGVERTVGADRVRVRLVHVARTVVDAVVRRKPEAAGL